MFIYLYLKCNFFIQKKLFMCLSQTFSLFCCLSVYLSVCLIVHNYRSYGQYVSVLLDLSQHEQDNFNEANVNGAIVSCIDKY